MRKVVVSSNCQTAGICAVLKALFPADEIVPCPLPWPFASDDNAKQFALNLQNCDVWVTIAPAGVIDSVMALVSDGKPSVVRVPAIGFAAFHPDLCYAQNLATGELTAYHYNSAIAVWAYKHRLDIEDTARLFNRANFRRLGYFDAWATSVAYLKQAFESYQLASDFDRFFLNVQRTGAFMHSINHPKIHVLVRLVKIISMRMGRDASVLEKSVDVDDALCGTVWPLYPEIAHELALGGGSYTWKLNPLLVFEGIRNYLEYSFKAYVTQEIAPENLQMLHREEALFDTVLKPQVGLPA